MGRATDLDGLWDLNERLFPHGAQDLAAFVPRPTDVIISPFAKCGTTWLQQMVHSIRTGGDQDFEDIYEVVPWIALGTQFGLDLDADQRADPRAFKSHANWDAVPKGCRYIVSFRDPQDAIVSLYRFLEGWLFEPGTVSLDEVVAARLFGGDDRGTYWHHTISWLEQRENPDVLLLTFDHMKRDLPGTVRRVAEFIGAPTDAERLAIATEQSSFAYMSTHAGPFEEPALKQWSIEHLDLPADIETSKVRVGGVGSNRVQLSADTAARIDEVWAEKVGSATGLLTYEDLVASLEPTGAAPA